MERYRTPDYLIREMWIGAKDKKLALEVIAQTNHTTEEAMRKEIERIMGEPIETTEQAEQPKKRRGRKPKEESGAAKGKTTKAAGVEDEKPISVKAAEELLRNESDLLGNQIKELTEKKEKIDETLKRMKS